MSEIVHRTPAEFEPPPFRPHRLIRGGHLQTVAAVRAPRGPELVPRRHVVGVSDGDAIVLHEDRPPGWRDPDPNVLLVHGLTGCHGAPYMVRLARRFVAAGVRAFRMDMRGCGAAFQLSQNLPHAGRSDDVVAALQWIAGEGGSGPISSIGVSLGGNQLLRAFGRIGSGIDPSPTWIDRVARIAAVSPPVDLRRCSEQMQHWTNRPYNAYFIRALLRRVPSRVRQREDFQRCLAGATLRTLRQLDDQITAPLSGYADADAYYAESSASRVTSRITVNTLVLAAADDPIVPRDCFLGYPDRWSPTTRLIVSASGGHVGFIDRSRRSWMDEVLVGWMSE